MIYFTAEDIFRSILCSIIYGVGYAISLTIFEVILSQKHNFGQYLVSVSKYERLTKIEHPDTSLKSYVSQNPIILAFSIFLFFIGYLLLSYFALDGVIRIYVLIIAIALTCLVRRTLGRFAVFSISKLIHLLISPIIIFLRIIMRLFIARGTKC